MTLTSNLTTKLISTLTNFWNFLNFSIFPNIVTFPFIPLATPLIFSSHHPLSNPLVFMFTQSSSLITILFNLLSLPTPLNSPLLSRYVLALGLNLTKHFSSNFFRLLLLTLLSLTLMTVLALDSLLNNTLNGLLPIKSFTSRLSSFKAPWLDGECISSKRTFRKPERSYRFSHSSFFHDLWLSHLATYRSILRYKHSNFCYFFYQLCFFFISLEKSQSNSFKTILSSSFFFSRFS